MTSQLQVNEMNTTIKKIEEMYEKIMTVNGQNTNKMGIVAPKS